VAVALRSTREALVALYGTMTATQTLLVEEVARLRVIARALSSWLLSRETLVGDGGEVLPALREYAAIVGTLRRLLVTLGLKGVEPEPQDLAAYLRDRARTRS
jgi:hypothetical protein